MTILIVTLFVMLLAGIILGAYGAYNSNPAHRDDQAVALTKMLANRMYSLVCLISGAGFIAMVIAMIIEAARR